MLTSAGAGESKMPGCSPRHSPQCTNCYRPLLVFSPTAAAARLKKQSELLDQDADNIMDRFVMFTPIVPSSKSFCAPLDTAYVVLSSQQIQAIRAQFQVPAESFLVLILGEDLGERLRITHPVDPMRLNALIDQMPARRRKCNGLTQTDFLHRPVVNLHQLPSKGGRT